MFRVETYCGGGKSGGRALAASAWSRWEWLGCVLLVVGLVCGRGLGAEGLELSALGEDQGWRLVSFLEDAGLRGRTVFDLGFESDGGLWLASDDGLVHYDGYEWRRYGPESGLPSRFVKSVLVLGPGQVWVGTDHGAGIFDGSTFDRAGSDVGLPGPSVRRIQRGADGAIWFSCDKWPDPQVGSGLARLKNGRWTVFGVADGLPSDHVNSFFEDSGGTRYVMTATGVAEQRGEGERWVTRLDWGGNPAGRVYGLAERGDGVVVGATDARCYLRRVGEGPDFRAVSSTNQLVLGQSLFMASTQTGDVFSLAMTSLGRLFVRWSGDRFEKWSDPIPGLQTGGSFVERAMEAPDGSLWAVGHDLLVRWQRQGGKWQEYSRLKWALFPDARGRMWFRTTDGFLATLEDGHFVVRSEGGQEAFLDPEGRVWMLDGVRLSLADDAGVGHQVASTGLVRVRSVLWDDRGRMWVFGSVGAGGGFAAAVWDGGVWLKVPLPGLAAGRAGPQVTVGRGGVLWFCPGSGAGSAVWSDGVKTGLVDLPVPRAGLWWAQVEVGGGDTHWLITPGGVFHREGISGGDWVPDEMFGKAEIRSAESNGEGPLVVLHGGGTSERFAIRSHAGWKVWPAPLLDSRIVPVHGTNFLPVVGGLMVVPPGGGGDGIRRLTPPVTSQVTTCVPGVGGALWMSTWRGLLRYQADGLPPRLKVLDVPREVVSGQPFPVRMQVTEAFSPSAEVRQVRVSWRLDGGRWGPYVAMPVNSIELGGVAAGGHRLEFRALDEDMEVSGVVATPVFSVLPEPIQTRVWFLPMVILVGLLLLGLAVLAWWQSRRLIAHAQGLSVLVGERTHELSAARDAAEAASVAKGRFLANMSHEIRTPLNGVMGMTQMLLETPLNEEQRGIVGTIMEGTEMLLRIINDILDFSKIEAGRMVLESVPFDVREVVESCVLILGVRARERGVALKSIVSSGVPDRLLGDPLRLRQVLLNLIGNAVKFTEQGEIRVRVSVGPGMKASAGNEVLRVEVSDTGIGMSPEETKRLFQPFVQGDSSTTRRFGGTGLGLAITRQLVDLMNGNLSLRSESGVGSVFTVCLPLKVPTVGDPGRVQLPADRTPTPVPTSMFGGVQPALGSLVWVVDEDPVNAKVVSLHLRRLGCRVEIRRPAEVLGAEVRLNGVQAVLVEWGLAGEPGGAVVDRLRSVAGGAELMIVGIAGSMAGETAPGPLAPRVDGWVGKPVSVAGLKQVLEPVLVTH